MQRRCATCKRTEAEGATFHTAMTLYCDSCLAKWDLSAKYQGEEGDDQ